MPLSTDFELMEKVTAGKQDAFMDLMRRHQPALLNFFRRLGADNDVEDLVQETFLRLFRYRHRYAPTAKFTTFLYTLARHTWADRWRKSKRRERLKEAVQKEVDDPMPDTAGRICARLDVRDAVAHLPEKLRLVLILSLYQGLGYEDIAGILRIPVGTVKSRMFTALNQLREVLDE